MFLAREISFWWETVQCELKVEWISLSLIRMSRSIPSEPDDEPEGLTHIA